MKNKDKACPKCQFLNYRVVNKCKNPEGCDHVFFTHVGKKGKRKPKPAPPPEDTTSFSAGIANDGGLLVFWYGKGEFTKFTPEETAVVRRIMALENPATGKTE